MRVWHRNVGFLREDFRAFMYSQWKYALQNGTKFFDTVFRFDKP